MRPETEADDRRHANGINDLNVVFSKENVTSLNLKHFRVSAALFRLTQALPDQLLPILNLEIEVGTRYILIPFVPRFVRHLMGIDYSGFHSGASRFSMRVSSEYKRRKNLSFPAPWAQI